MGYVYVLRRKDTNHYKIGRTKNLEQRLKSYKLPFDCDLIHVIKCGRKHSSLEIENFIHFKFSPYRINGLMICGSRPREWFELSDSDLVHIKLLKDTDCPHQVHIFRMLL